MQRKPVAVLISDVHYNLNNLKLADAAMRQATDKAQILGVPFIVAGDLHDTKANLRGECVNAILETFSHLKLKALVLVGNHDKINEKSEDNALGFLEGHVNFICDHGFRSFSCVGRVGINSLNFSKFIYIFTVCFIYIRLIFLVIIIY